MHLRDGVSFWSHSGFEDRLIAMNDKFERVMEECCSCSRGTLIDQDSHLIKRPFSSEVDVETRPSLVEDLK